MKQLCLRLFAAISFLALGTCAHAMLIIVTATEDLPDQFPGNGECKPELAVQGTCTLRAAIMEANAHDDEPHTILLPSGTYVLDHVGADEDLAVTGDLDILTDITIANFTDDAPVIYGNFSDRVFDIHPGAKLTLNGVNVAGGMANQPGTVHGGAFRVAADAELELQRSTVSGNIANIGGAIYSDGLVRIFDSEFYHNALVDDHVNSQFTDGAAILNRGKLGVYNSTFRHNGVIPGGEGIVLNGEHVIESRVGFTENPAVTLYQSTFYENTNGVFSDGVPTVVLLSTFVGNGQRGLRFLLDLDNLGVEQHRVAATVLHGHTSDCNGIPVGHVEYAVTDQWNVSSDESCGFTGASDHQNIGYPFLGGPGNHGGPTSTFMPRSDSVLVDAPGLNCALDAPFDQRGQPRPADGNGDGVASCDIGAVEYQAGSDPAVPDQVFSDRFASG